MEISTKTRLDVNSFMTNTFKTKGNVGYSFIKRMLEYLLEEYKQNGYIDSFSINKLSKKVGILQHYTGVQRAINYFLRSEGVELNTKDFLIDTVERIIDSSKENIIEEEEEF